MKKLLYFVLAAVMLTCATVFVASAANEPIIFRFNNDDMLANWSGDGWAATPEDPSIVDGVAKINGFSNDGYGISSFTYSAGTAANQFNLADYPYVKYKFRYTSDAVPFTQLYVYKEGAVHGVLSGHAGHSANNGNWVTVTADFSSNANYTGTLALDKSIDLWIRHEQNATGSVELEYIAFFPNTSAGKTAWQNFDSANPDVKGSSDAYLPDYNQVNPIMTAVKKAFEEIDSTIKVEEQALAAITDAFNTAKGNVQLKKAEITFVEKVHEGFVYRVTLEKGDNANQRTVLSEEITVINNTPGPIIWKFNNAEFCAQWSPNGGYVDLKPGYDDGVSYMDVNATKPGDNINMSWVNIPEENRFELSEYKYWVMRYRSTHAGVWQLYPSTTTSKNAGASADFYTDGWMESQTGEWVTMKRQIPSTWEGVLDFLRVDFMRAIDESTTYRNIDVEYIAFFATEEEADAYIGQVEGDITKTQGCLELIDEEAFSKSYKEVNDEASAKKKLDELVANIQAPEGVRIAAAVTGIVETDPALADNCVGKAVYRIDFIHGPLGSSAVTTYHGYLPLAPSPVFKTLSAQLRTGSNSGIRFGTKLDTGFMEDVDVTNVVYGTVILPHDMIPTAQELTLETAGAVNVVANNIFEEADDYLIYTAVLRKIPEESLDTSISARSYIKFNFGGNSYTFYSDSTKTVTYEGLEGLMYDGYAEELDLTGEVYYDQETWLKPFWKGDTVYHELFWPVMADDARPTDDLVVDLLYPISDVIAVKNGYNNQDFVEGKDFYVNDKGQLVIPYGSAINRTPFKTYMSDNMDALHDKPVANKDAEYADQFSKYYDKWLYFTEGTTIQGSFQYSITYRHNSTWDENAINPEEEYEEDALPTTRAKLEAGTDFTIGYFGDSITAGGNQTGSWGAPPYTIHWRDAIVTELENMYGVNIDIRNHARGGEASIWGANNAASLFAKNRKDDTFDATTLIDNGDPTLFILAFGMNDINTTPADFKANTKKIIEQIHAIYPDCEFLLVSTSMPNAMWMTTRNREQHETVLEELVTEFRAKNVNIDCARLQSVHKHILTIKEYRDMSGNNVNHQNDMLSRLYAQTLLAYIVGER